MFSCKGLDIELDNCLVKFRNVLKKGVNFELLIFFIDDVFGFLK